MRCACFGRPALLGVLVSFAQQGNPFPRYPAPLRAAEIEGEVTIRFSTDVTGAPDSTTFKVVSSTPESCTTAVLAVLPRWRVAPNTTVQRRFVFLMQDQLATLRPDPSGRTTYITAARPAHGRIRCS